MINRTITVAVNVAVAMVLLGCSKQLPPLAEKESGAYVLGPGDEVRVITFGDDKLTAQFRVSDNGNIAMPLIGDVKAVGLTPNELGRDISQTMTKKQLLNNPSVSVEVLTYRPIFVLGEVTRPGQYPYSPGMTVIQAVSMAGGYTYRAVQDSAEIVRSQGHHGSPVEGSVKRNSVLEPGDVINVNERLF